MLKFRRKGQTSSKIEELSPDHFTFRKTAYHGFPNSPTAVSFDPESQLLAIGTKHGELRIYGRPGLEFRATTESGTAIKELFSFSGLHQCISVSEDNVVMLWEMDSEGQPTITSTKEFKLDPEGGKTITKCCLSQLSGHFYIGTEGGNVFILDVKHFQLDSEIIYWNNTTALVQPSSKTHPGLVQCLELCPTDMNKLLIGYEKGVIVLWDLNQGLPSKNFPATIQDCQQPLDSLAWQKDGQKFVSAHSDSSIYYWSVNNSSPNEGPTHYYGDSGCLPINKIQWLNTDANPLLMFTGGLPEDQEDEHHALTVVQGADHIALDFTSPIVDFIPITDPSTQRGKAVLVLCEQELMAFDLEAPKCPQIRKPYLFSLHDSPVTCVRLYENCPQELYESLHEVNITSPPPHEHFSTMEWPAMGGCVRASDPTSFDILITGHDNGMVRFWDVTTGAMRLIYELKTANLFVGQEPEANLREFEEFSWPPYRKVSSYDPFEDDPRLAIKFIEFCPHSRTLCVGGNGGQVITFSLNPLPNEIRLECAKAEIFLGRSEPQRRFRNESALECKSDLLALPAGFQATFCLQCMPATTVTAIAFQPSWDCDVAAGNSKGFAVANFLVKRIVLVHPTVAADGLRARSLGRVQSLRRSIRDSFRRRRTTSMSAVDDRKVIADTLNLESGSAQKKGRGIRRTNTQPSATTSPLHQNRGEQVAPELAGYVTCLTFADTHASGGGSSPAVFAATMGSVILRYSLTLPSPNDRLHQINRAFIAGKDYALLHAAPVVSIFILDHSGIPIPDPYEVENHMVPAADMHHPHFAVICTQEQVKIISLPSMRQKRKEKIIDLIQERIYRTWVMRVKVAAAPVGSSRDWNPALAILTNMGNLLVYALPSLRFCFQQEGFIMANDQKALQSATISMYGEALYLRSFSELERSLLCSYGFSYHTTMLPSLFPFEGSTQLVQAPRRTSSTGRQTVQVEVEENAVDAPDGRGRRSRTPSPESSHAGAEAIIVNDIGSSVEKEDKPQPVKLVHVQRTSDAMNHAQQYLNATSKGPLEKEKLPSPPVDNSELIASATAFTQLQRQKHGSTSSASSSDSSSSSDSESSGEEGGVLPTPPSGKDTTLQNPFVMDFDELGDGSRELDNIIASSLQQLESARAFYEQMQARAKKPE